MGPVSGVVVYLLVWWTTLFAVLPWGVRQPDRPENFVGGAPVRANIKKKLVATTLISAIIWCVIAWLIHIQIISFRTVGDTLPFTGAS
jgi:predicted secreted protein